jgi:acyl-CoA dehydrogenase
MSQRSEEQVAMIRSVWSLCQEFPDSYWQQLDETSSYPERFVDALTQAGWLSMLIPEEYGGGGASILDAALVLETINRSGAAAYCAHAQMYTMGTLLRHGSEGQKLQLLPEIAAGRIRLQAFGVTEADAGSDTTAIATRAECKGDRYVITGSKMWTSRVQHSDWMLLLARTTPLAECARKTDGLSIFLVDLRETAGRLEVRPLRTMVNHETNALFFDGVEVPAKNLIGEPGKGFQYLLSGLNAERILVASEAIGDGRFFVSRSTEYASSRHVFGRPIGANQAIQFPIAAAHAKLECASLMRDEAARRYIAGNQPGFEANCAKLVASEAAWEAANVAMNTFGGFGMATEYGIERKFRESRLTLIAPVSNNMILAYIGQHTLGMPRSY